MTRSKNFPEGSRINSPVFAGVPILNTTVIAPLLPMEDKEIRFADMVWSGLTPYLAYREVYGIPDSMSGDMINQVVNRRLWTRATRIRINQLDKIMCDMDIKSAENRRNFVLEGLTSLASDESITPMTRLKALELLGKVRGTDLFSDKVEHVVQSMSEEQVKAALAEKLAQLGAGAAEKLEDLKQDIKVIEHRLDDAQAPPASKVIEHVRDDSQASSHEHTPSGTPEGQLSSTGSIDNGRA